MSKRASSSTVVVTVVNYSGGTWGGPDLDDLRIKIVGPWFYRHSATVVLAAWVNGAASRNHIKVAKAVSRNDVRPLQPLPESRNLLS